MMSAEIEAEELRDFFEKSDARNIFIRFEIPTDNTVCLATRKFGKLEQGIVKVCNVMLSDCYFCFCMHVDG